MKKQFLLAFVLIVSTVVFGGISASAETEGIYTYMVSNDEATITDCDDSVSGELIIPETLGGYPVTKIGDNAFYQCSHITSLRLGDNITAIGDYAFWNCYDLEKVDIGNNVTAIGDYAFEACYNITDIKFGDNITTIGNNAFANNRCLTTIDIPNTVITIGNEAFSNFSSLTEIEIGYNVQTIGERAFANCLIERILIPDSVTKIGNNAFAECSSLAKIYVDKNNPNYCSLNGDLFTKDESTLIQYAIGKTEASYTIPDNVEAIKDGAFLGCKRLTDISVNETNTNFCSVDGNLFNKDKTTLIQYAIGKTDTSYTIPDSVTKIGYGAFWGCRNLTDVKIRDGVVIIGDYAFSYCYEPLNVDMGDGVETIGKYAFSGCDFTKLYIGYGVTVIGEGAFSDCYLTTITIPNNVTIIGDYAFWRCRDLTKVKIGDGVKQIGDYAFSNCYNLTDVELGDNIEIIGTEAFFATNIKSIDLPNNLSIIGDASFSSNNLQNVTIPSSVKKIGYLPFISDSLIRIAVDENNENYCSVDGNLFNKDKTTLIQYAIGKTDTSYTIPDSVTKIGYGAFGGSISLISVTIGNNVKNIANNAFNGCNSLKDVYYKGTKNEWNEIQIDVFNEYFTDTTILTNSTIHYVPCTRTTTSDNGKTFTIAPVNIENGKTVILALYDGDTFVEMQSSIYMGESIPFTTTKTYTNAKVMVWDNLTNIKPICGVEIVK